MTPRIAVLLVGSPRGMRSASRTLGQRLLAGLASRGLAVETHSILSAVFTPEKEAAMLQAALAADVLVFSFPLYVDQLPAPAVRVLELLAAHDASTPVGTAPLLAAIVQCGFPETHQNQPAIDIMRRFAQLNGFTWAGGLALGMGGAAGTALPEKPTGMLRNVVRALDQAAEALAEGRPIPPDTSRLMGQPLMPQWLYLTVGNWQWRWLARKIARKTGRTVDLYARPYA